MHYDSLALDDDDPTIQAFRPGPYGDPPTIPALRSDVVPVSGVRRNPSLPLTVSTSPPSSDDRSRVPTIPGPPRLPREASWSVPDALAAEVATLRLYLVGLAWVCAISIGMNCAQTVVLFATHEPSRPATLLPIALPDAQALVPTVEVEADALAPLAPQAQPAHLVVDVDVPGAVVHVVPEGEAPLTLRGAFPRELRLDPGRYTISAGRAGYERHRRELVLEEGAREVLSVELRHRSPGG